MKLFVRLVCLIGAALASLTALASPTTIRLVTWEGDEAMKAIRRALASFERAHPDIRVKVEVAPYDVYQDKLLAQYAAGVAPDVALQGPQFFQKFAKRDALLPLDDLIEATPGFDLSAYYQEIVQACRWQDRLYILPRDIAPIGLIYYNKEIFRKAGLREPDGSWTWDFSPRPELREKDFTWVMQQLTQRDGTGKVTRWGYGSAWPQLWADTATYSQGARYCDDPADPTRVLLSDPRTVRAYQFCQDLALKQKWTPSQVELTTQLLSNVPDLWVQGKIAMFQSGIWEVPNLRKKLKPGTPGFFEWDICMAPAFRDGVRAFPSGGSGYCILKSTRNPAAAWELVKWMAGEPAMLEAAAAGLAQPAIRKLARQSPWIPDANTPLAERYPANRIVTDQAVPFAVFDPTSDLWPEVRSYANQRIDSIFLGSSTAETALAEAGDRAQSRLDALRQFQTLPAFQWPWAIAAGLAIVGAIAAWVFWPDVRRGRRLTRKERAEARTAYIFLLPWIAGLLIFILGPMIFSLVMSFSDWDVIRAAKWRAGGNYAEAFTQDPRFLTSLRVTLTYTLTSVPLGLVVALLLALLLNTKVRGIALFRTCFYLPTLASGVAAALVWRGVFKADGGLLNSIIYGANGDRNLFGLASLLAPLGNPGEPINWLGNEKTALSALVIMSLWGVGGAMIILLAGLQGIPQHYYEAAQMDGAGPVRRFWNITLPMLSPALMFSTITGVIGSFQVFTQGYVMTGGGPNEATMFYMLHLYTQAFTNLRMGYASALAWVLFFIVLIFTILQLRLNRLVYYEGGNRS